MSFHGLPEKPELIDGITEARLTCWRFVRSTSFGAKAKVFNFLDTEQLYVTQAAPDGKRTLAQTLRSRRR